VQRPRFENQDRDEKAFILSGFAISSFIVFVQRLSCFPLLCEQPERSLGEPTTLQPLRAGMHFKDNL
jgi:hypothetical protein